MNNAVDFENKDFWVKSIKKSIAKRMIKREHDYPKTIEDVCGLEPDEVKNLLCLQKTFIIEYDHEKREMYLNYYRGHKYEDWECKRIIDLNEIDVYELSEGKGQSYHLDIENMVELELIDNGEKIAKNLALIEMIDLKYPKEAIENVLGDDKTEYVYFQSFIIPKEITDKMKNHFMNMGIDSKRYEILQNLLLYENNLENASRITGLTISEIESYISANSMFKSDDNNTVLDASKVLRQKHLWNCELLIECLVNDGIEEYYIEYYSKLSEIDEDYFKKIYDLYHKFKQDLNELINEMVIKLMDQKYDFDELEEISGRGMYDTATGDYYFKKFKEYLNREYIEAIK